MSQSVTGQLVGLMDFEQKSLLCTTPLPPFKSPFLLLQLHPSSPPPPFFPPYNKTPKRYIFLKPTPNPQPPPAHSLRPLNSIQPPLLEHRRPTRIQPPKPVDHLPPQSSIRMLLPRNLHLPPRTLPRLPIRTRSPTSTRSPILSPTHPRLYTASNW